MTEVSDKPGYAFTPGPPPEVTAYFRNKGLRPSFSWQDVEPEEHAVAFSAARAMRIDVLEALRGALQEAIDAGVPYRRFAAELKPRLQALGWWGVRDQIDPLTGKARKVRLGSPRRLRTIYRANLRAARAAGQWDRIQRTKRALPYLLYLLGPSERHRPQHEAKAGLVLPVDDPFWQTWYPPNGWGCKCHVRQITRREAEAHGISESPDIPMREVVNTRTGEIKRIPSGIDPGWETNPAMHRRRQMERFLAGKLDAADPDIARAAARDMASSWRLRRIHEGAARGSVPVAMLPAELADIIGARTRVVRFSDDAAERTRRTPSAATADEFVRIADLIETGTVAHEASGAGPERLIFESREEKPWRLVLERTAEGDGITLDTFHRSSPDGWRRLLERPNVRSIRE